MSRAMVATDPGAYICRMHVRAVRLGRASASVCFAFVCLFIHLRVRLGGCLSVSKMASVMNLSSDVVQIKSGRSIMRGLLYIFS